MAQFKDKDKQVLKHRFYIQTNIAKLAPHYYYCFLFFWLCNSIWHVEAMFR